MTRALKTFARYLILLTFFVLTVYPLVWMAYTSSKTNAEVTASRWSLPDGVRATNFAKVFQIPEGAGFVQAVRAAATSRFARYFVNTVAISTVAVGLATAAAALAGFAFARIRFFGSSVLFVLFLAGMMIPVHITLVPLVRLFGGFHPPMALVTIYIGFALPVSVFILRGFFRDVPPELEEAARIDGCSTWGVFWHVCLPLARPALAVVIIFNLITIANEFVFALVFLKRTGERTLPVGLGDFSRSEGAADVPLLCAALVCATLPMVVAYLAAQRHIIKGLTSGAVKG